MLVRPAATRHEIDAALGLRERVFCGEQGVSMAAERDGLDPGAVHVVALEGDRVVGTCRLVFEGRVAHLGRMAVEPTRRETGVGGAVLDAAERSARERGAERISLHAQIAALRLYERRGYAARGEVFVEEGMDHMEMDKTLA